MSELEPSALEDLFREHGLLNRLLIIYETFIQKLRNKKKFNPKLIYLSALIIKKFVEEYHEKTEEKFIFPLILEKGKNKETQEMVTELILQHKISRQITRKILKYSSKKNLNISKLILLLESFVELYRYHESREDTEIFQEVYKLLTPTEYVKLGKLLDEEEDETLGKGGYEKSLEIVKIIEKKLGIYDLNIVTTKTKNKLSEIE